MLLSIVIPAYNEEARIGATLDTIITFVKKNNLLTEILVVNDGSKDKTTNIVSRLAQNHSEIKLIDVKKNAGKACALKVGVAKSRGNLLLITDADLSTPIEEFFNLKEKYDLGFRVVYASRGQKDSKVLKRQNIFRELVGGRLVSIFLQYLLITGIKDTQCGFKLINGELARDLFKKLTTTNSALWDMEILILATMLGVTAAECPVIWVHNPDTRLPYTLKYIFNTAVQALKLKYEYKIILPLQVNRFKVAKY